MSRRTIFSLLALSAIICSAGVGCETGEEQQPAATGSGAASTSNGGAGGTSGGSSATTSSEGGFAPNPEEICDGLDNDSDGTVDEDCSCESGTTQQCYPMANGPPDGCKWGEQSCEMTSWAVCKGASLPPEGEETCCTALEGTVVHPAYDAYLMAYPAANMPKSVAAVMSFIPAIDGQKMKWAETKVADEFVDKKYGGVIEENINKGRAFTKQEAVSSMPADAKIVAEKESPVTIEKLGGQTPCDGVGWAWGSFLYQTPDEAVAELVYLYVGFCNDGDIEGFYYSEEPVVICKPPRVPN